jgi:SAM-dependent methyltransferase
MPSHSQGDGTVLERLQNAWENFAKNDPLWAILSWPEKKGRKWKLAEFFKTGEDEVQQLITTLAVNDIPFVSEAALDFGCGVGRLSQALARHFDAVYGVDISPQMIKTAVQLNQYGEKCRYFVNAKENLRIFDDGTFTFIYSNIVLQHIPLILTRGYLQEFLRVLRPGGLLIFQLPSKRRRVDHSLPPEGWSAWITSPLSEIVMRPASQIAVPFRVTNLSPIPWEHDGQAYFALGNHWLDEHGNLMRLDDGRTPLPLRFDPNDSVDLNLEIIAPRRSGDYLLELDVVHEGVAWFADNGSRTLRLPVRVIETAPDETITQTSEAKAEITSEAKGTLQDEPFDGMYCMPRADVLQILRGGGAYLEFIQPFECAGPGFQSYRYFFRKGEFSAKKQQGMNMSPEAESFLIGDP